MASVAYPLQVTPEWVTGREKETTWLALRLSQDLSWPLDGICHTDM